MSAVIMRFLTASAVWLMVVSAGPSSETLTPKAAPAALEFDQELHLTGFGIPANAWSPVRDAILLTRGDTLYVLDLERGPTPRQIGLGNVTRLAWSSNGRFVACRVVDPSGPFIGVADLVVIDPVRAVSETLGRDLPFHEFIPGDYGSVFTWDDDESVFRKVPSRRLGFEGKAETAALRGTTPIVVRSSPPSRLARIVEGELRVTPMTGGASPAGWARGPDVLMFTFFVADAFPDGALLVNAQRPDHQTIVTDTLGNLLRVVASPAAGDQFSGNSVTHDGRFVLGYTSRDSGDATVDARILAYDMNARAIRPVRAPRGVLPQASRNSSRIAFPAFDRPGGIVIGRIRTGL